MTATKQPTMMVTKGVARGDLVFVIGVRSHGALIAKLVLFAAPPTATATPTPTVTPTVTSTATATPTVTPSGNATTFSGTNA
jgi:hypothetical protein